MAALAEALHSQPTDALVSRHFIRSPERNANWSRRVYPRVLGSPRQRLGFQDDTSSVRFERRHAPRVRPPSGR